MKRVSLVVASGACLMVGACSSVSVHKIDPDTDDVKKNSAEGVRYYMPRPYVSVTEPFVIDARVFVAQGQLSPDSNYVLITKADQNLQKLAPLIGTATSMGNISVASVTVTAADTSAPSGPQGASASTSNVTNATKTQTGNTNGSGAASGKDDTKGGTDAPKSQPKSGTTNNKVTNDTTAILVTPQPRYFNIVWLPDFDEQYVISTKQGLGKASATISLIQGWGLQGLDSTVDNSALTQPLLDFYSGTLGALQKLATSTITGPVSAVTGGSPQGARAQAQTAAAFAGGTPVTVKVTVARIVAPGLYPILKPKEITRLEKMERNVGSGVAPGPDDLLPLTGEEQARILVPKPPFTNIAFNTYETVVIEAARATGDNAFHALQNSETTGGTGKIAAIGQGGGQSKPLTTTSVDPPTAALKKLNDILVSSVYVTTSGDYYVASSAQSNEALTITLTKKPGGSGGTLPALPSDDKLKAFVVKTLKDNGVAVDEANVTISK